MVRVAGQNCIGDRVTKNLKNAYRRFGFAAVVLLYQIIQVCVLPDFDAVFLLLARIEAVHRRFIGSALIKGHDLWSCVLANALVEKATGGIAVPVGGQQKVYRIAGRVHCPIKRAPPAFNVEIGFILPPPPPHGALVLAERLIQ